MKHQGFEQSQIWIELRDFLKVSNNEYILLDVIRREQGLSDSGWCDISPKEMASMVGIKPRNLYKMLRRLLADALIVRSAKKGAYRVSPIYSEAYANRERMAAYIRGISTTTKTSNV